MLLTVNDVALVLPNFTAMTPVKLVPVIVTIVLSRLSARAFGDTAVTVGVPA